MWRTAFPVPSVRRSDIRSPQGDCRCGGTCAQSDLAAAMLQQLTDGRFVHKAMGIVTTEVRPSIAKLLWTEATRKRS